MKKNTLTMVIVAAVTFLAASPALLVAGPVGAPGTQVVPPAAQPLYDNLVIDWWQWFLSFPNYASPFNSDVGCVEEGHSDNVFFLAGSSSGILGEPVIRECTVPVGSFIFFPLINADCSSLEPDPFACDDEASCRACTDPFFSENDELILIIDDQVVGNLHDFRIQSDVFPVGPLPADNFFGAEEGAEGFALADGYYVLLAPLSVGEHTILFGGCFDAFGGCEAWEIRVMYDLTVVDNDDD